MAGSQRYDPEDRRAWVVWAADCAGRAIGCFEKRHPGDGRPRKALEAARAWARGEIGMKEIRAAAVAAHAAAREATDAAARFAARAAGQAVAAGALPSEADAVSASERAWQQRRIPEKLK